LLKIFLKKMKILLDIHTKIVYKVSKSSSNQFIIYTILLLFFKNIHKKQDVIQYSKKIRIKIVVFMLTFQFLKINRQLMNTMFCDTDS